MIEQGAIYVGRITVNGYRYFHFYVKFPEQTAFTLVDKVAQKTSYKINYNYRKDAAKKVYWKELFPTNDDWQVIQDLKVLSVLRENGDKPQKSHVVLHWAYFPELKSAKSFGDWVKANHYKLISIEFTDDNKKYGVHFSHVSSMDLEEITHHTIAINRKAIEMNGDYDGWDTNVEH